MGSASLPEEENGRRHKKRTLHGVLWSLFYVPRRKRVCIGLTQKNHKTIDSVDFCIEPTLG